MFLNMALLLLLVSSILCFRKGLSMPTNQGHTVWDMTTDGVNVFIREAYPNGEHGEWQQLN